MEHRILEREIPYSGKELKSGFVAEMSGIVGDAAIGFVGPCHVENGDLVDLDDVRAGEYIHSASMAHVIVEHVGCDMRSAVLRQRLLVWLLCEILLDSVDDIRRDGDDVYCGMRKLTVSIAAPSSTSCLIHLGINIDPAGAPVPAVGLAELGIEPATLLAGLLDRYCNELASCGHAV